MKHRLVRALLAHYLERAGEAGPFHLTFSAARYERARKRRGYDGEAQEHRDFGATLYGRPPLVWVNVPRHRTMAELSHTLAHEAVHVALQTGAHPSGFDTRVRRLLRGGRL